MPAFLSRIRSTFWPSYKPHAEMAVPAEPPKIQINEVFAPNMGLNGFGNLLSDPETPTKQNGESVSTTPRSRIS